MSVVLVEYLILTGPASSKMKMAQFLLFTQLETIMSLNYIHNENITIILSISLLIFFYFLLFVVSLYELL